MLLTNKHIKKFAVFYLACFLVNYVWMFANGLLLSSIDPVFFINRLDITRNLLMLTGLQKAVLNNTGLCIFFDITFLLLPILLTFIIVIDKKGRAFFAIITAIFSLVYALLLTGVCYLSIEGFVGWMLVPLIFCGATPKPFYYYLHSLRIVVILIIFSAGLWKIRAGGLFNPEQMSGILLTQHAAYLVSDPQNWFTKLVYFLVGHQTLSYILYIAATFAELIFFIGLFTKKYDRPLIIIFFLFLVFDYFLMRINYFNWAVLMGCFYFSKYYLPEETNPV